MKLYAIRVALMLSLLLTLTPLCFAQKGEKNPSDEPRLSAKPTPKPTPVPTPTPPVDTKCYIGAGCIDATFGNNGVRLLPGEAMAATALQADGKILTVGYGPGAAGLADAIIVRLNPDGTLDTTFGTVDPQNPLVRLGYRYDDIDTLKNRARAVAVQPDGRIVVGMSRVEAGSSLWTIVRFEANGDRDITFGNAGVILSNISSSLLYSLALQSDGRIVAAGGDWVARFNYSGTPDTTFGTNGTGTINLAPQIESYDVVIHVIQGQERIVLGGYQSFVNPGRGRTTSHSEFSIIRLLPNGQFDTSFGTGGKVNTFFGYGDNLLGLSIDANNRIVASGIVGTAGPQAAGVARYTENGTLDLSFGAGTGKVSTLVNGFRTTSQDVLLQPDGRIVIVGSCETATTGSNLALIRYNSDGSPDASFGPGIFGPGIVTADISGSHDGGNTGIILQDGGIAAGGSTNSTSFFTRYIP